MTILSIIRELAHNYNEYLMYVCGSGEWDQPEQPFAHKYPNIAANRTQQWDQNSCEDQFIKCDEKWFRAALFARQPDVWYPSKQLVIIQLQTYCINSSLNLFNHLQMCWWRIAMMWSMICIRIHIMIQM